MANRSSNITAWAITLAAAVGAYIVLKRTRQSNPPSLIIDTNNGNMKNYFGDKEFTRSTTAEQRGISNEPDAATWQRIHALRDNILNPARANLGYPIYITSGYRSPYLNSLVGGAANSQHVTGEAADITTRDLTLNRALFEVLVKLGNFDQLIWEKGGEWIHVSFRPIGRGQMLAYDGSKYTNINNNWQNVV